MKTNLFRVAFFALATTFMAACSQEENPVSEQQETLQVLNVTADATGFASTETARATDDLSTGATTFEEGDTIGVYVIENEKAIIKNMKLERNAEGKWAGTTPLYVYDGATYLAYFPYSENMSAASITSIDDLKTQLAANWDADQSTLTKYQACDGMVSTGALTTTEGSTTASLKFSFSHVLSMIQLNIPTYKYQSSTGYKYSAPMNWQEFKITYTENNENKTIEALTSMYVPEAGNGDIRRIVVPAGIAYTINGYFLDPKDNKPVKFNVTTAALEEGKYQGYNLTYNGVPGSTYENRDLQVGDYFYSDGSICPKEFNNIPTEGCAGLIFHLTTSEKDQANGWKNGYVIALNDATEGTWLDVWYTATDTTTWSRDLYVKDFAVAQADMDGYTHSQVTSSGTGTFKAIDNAKAYNVSIPSNTSGWYLPSTGQLLALYNNFAIIANEDISTTLNSFGDKPVDSSILTAFKEAFTKCEGTLSYKKFWWTSNYGTNNNISNPIAGSSNISTGDKLGILYRFNASDFTNKSMCTNSDCTVRPVFAF